MSTDGPKSFTIRRVESGLCCWIKNSRPTWYLRQVILYYLHAIFEIPHIPPQHWTLHSGAVHRPAVLGTSIRCSQSTLTSKRLSTGIWGASLIQKPKKCPIFDVTHLVVLSALTKSACSPSNTICTSRTSCYIKSSYPFMPSSGQLSS
jgi:hypothetical protein